MFGIGKILGIIKAVAPFLQFIPALAPFAALFNIADTVANLVKDFKNGFSFLDLVAKFAPLPKPFGQNLFSNCFGLNSLKIGSFQSNFLPASKEFNAFNLFKEAIESRDYINTIRTNSFYSRLQAN